MGSQLRHRRDQRGFVGILDDDEEIDSNWFVGCFSAFADPTVDFIGGTKLPEFLSAAAGMVAAHLSCRRRELTNL